MRNRAALTLIVTALVALAGCGSGGGGSVPQGNPDGRHGPEAVDDYAAVELLRARLVASSDGFYAGGSPEAAAAQLQRARAAYNVLAGRVKAKDPVVDREVAARFDLLARDLSRGVRPDHYRDLANPLSDQLMDGVSQALVPEAARSDRGVQAETLRRVMTLLSGTYDASTGPADDPNTEVAFQESWGLWRRALALTALMKPNLGAQKNTVAGTLNGLRGSAFANGARMSDNPRPQKVEAASGKVNQALSERFGFDAA